MVCLGDSGKAEEGVLIETPLEGEDLLCKRAQIEEEKVDRLEAALFSMAGTRRNLTLHNKGVYI